MELILYRDTYTEKSTVGKLYYEQNGEEVYFCETLEDARRLPGIKIPGETCIPAGRYRVDITESSRFGRDMPILFNCAKPWVLKGEGISFKGIRMHGGNTHRNTEGCILVAERRLDDDTIQGTKESDLTTLIVNAMPSFEECWLEIHDHVEGV